MTDGQTYYDGLIAQGYPADQALGYTQQYYPGFYPATAATAPMPMPAQPVAQPQAVSQPQMIQPVAQTIPMQQPMMNTATVGMAPMGMAAMPVADNKPIMAWAAVGCIFVALILACVGQLGNSWLVQDDESIENDSGQVSFGLSNIVVDCTEVAQEQQCIQFAYVALAEDMDKAATETPPSDSKVKGSIENYCENIYSITISLAGDNQEMRSEAGDLRENCLSNDSAGAITGITMWIAILGVLMSGIMLTMSIIGKELPGNIQQYGRISSFVSGGLVILGTVIWLLMKYDFDGIFDNGSSFYFTFFAGTPDIVAGVLDIFDKR